MSKAQTGSNLTEGITDSQRVQLEAINKRLPAIRAKMEQKIDDEDFDEFGTYSNFADNNGMDGDSRAAIMMHKQAAADEHMDEFRDSLKEVMSEAKGSVETDPAGWAQVVATLAFAVA